jgi:hypothetical protein
MTSGAAQSRAPPDLMPATTFEMVLDDDRRAIHEKIDSLPNGSRVMFKGPKRSLIQNAHMWALLTDLSEQVIWYGEHLPPEDWKDVTTASLRKCRVVPTIDGDGWVPLGMRTSEMSVEEMNALIEFLYYFGARESVRWKAPKWLEERANQQRGARATP